MGFDVMEWIHLGIRWIHIITGIAWIGASFYFIWLDMNLTPPEKDGRKDKDGVGGELWAIHGGGFYEVQKYRLAPPTLPAHLHWFKYEAYFTWISGFALLCVLYYFGAEIYLIDKSVADISTDAAILIGLGSLVGGWVIYDFLCKTPLIQHQGVFGLVLFILLTAAAWGLSLVFSGRGAYIHVGAIIGTIMAANVLMIIMPGQRALVAAAEKGEVPDPEPGLKAKQRSLHNNYFTLPVLFIMISNHYPGTFGHEYSWLVLAGLALVGILVRHFFNMKNQGKAKQGFFLLPLSFLLFFLVAYFAAPKAIDLSEGPVVPFATVHAIIEERCVSCHAQKPSNTDFEVAPKAVKLETVDQIKREINRIRQQVVESDAMPLGNVTEMTPEERLLLGRWIAQGGKTE
ncbi:urate hydroxylase PuuD [Sneathiella glossodoripedis]|uniref:urate hydroxylase PuuD n=1 Tax=Sneathiella glossodoripedis TaxID=418853 RepID=UPI000568D2D1|nr:urate hydroxylase PuuD [Sneathiella glossodoripedis]